MGESRLVMEELLTLCLQRIRVEESSRNTEQGEGCWPGPAPSLKSSCSKLLHPSFRDDQGTEEL